VAPVQGEDNVLRISLSSAGRAGRAGVCRRSWKHAGNEVGIPICMGHGKQLVGESSQRRFFVTEKDENHMHFLT